MPALPSTNTKQHQLRRLVCLLGKLQLFNSCISIVAGCLFYIPTKRSVAQRPPSLPFVVQGTTGIARSEWTWEESQRQAPLIPREIKSESTMDVLLESMDHKAGRGFRHREVDVASSKLG